MRAHLRPIRPGRARTRQDRAPSRRRRLARDWRGSPPRAVRGRIAPSEIMFGKEIMCRKRAWVPRFRGDEGSLGCVHVARELRLHSANQEGFGRQRRLARGLVHQRESMRRDRATHAGRFARSPSSRDRSRPPDGSRQNVAARAGFRSLSASTAALRTIVTTSSSAERRQ